MREDSVEALMSPFVHLFQTSTARYAYDVNTRRILRLAEPVWRLLNGEISEGDADGPAAMSAIREAQKNGLLLANRPKRVKAPAEDFLRRHLDGRRQQLILEVTSACNFRCRYCLVMEETGQAEHHAAAMMPWENICSTAPPAPSRVPVARPSSTKPMWLTLE